VNFPSPSKSWVMELYYSDLAGLLHYVTSFSERGFVQDHKPMDSKAWLTRFRLWRANRRIIKTINAVKR
jgi:hypothetical protein